MTTFSASNLQNEALAKIGVFQNPKDGEYYYGGKRDENDNVTGEIVNIHKEEAEKLAQQYIELDKKSANTKGRNIPNPLNQINLRPDQDGNYRDRAGNILLPDHILKLINSMIGIDKLTFGSNINNIEKVRSNLPSPSPEQEKEINKRGEIIKTSENLLETILSSYLKFQGKIDSFGDMNNPHNIEGQPSISKYIYYI